MAKTAWIERNKRKAATVKKYAAIRAELKARRDYAGLAKLPRDASPSRLVNRCSMTGRRRGYLRSDREWLGSMGSSSGYLSVLVLALYINSDQVVALYRTPLLLWLVCPLLLLWIGRMWLLAYRGQIHEDPIVATVSSDQTNPRQ